MMLFGGRITSNNALGVEAEEELTSNEATEIAAAAAAAAAAEEQVYCQLLMSTMIYIISFSFSFFFVFRGYYLSSYTRGKKLSSIKLIC